MCIGIEQSIRIIDSLSTRRVEGLLIFHCTSRRLLATAQALEAGWSFPPWVPPSDKRYLSCALNVFTTELSVADAAVADQFVYYARRPTAPTGASGASAAAALLGAAASGGTGPLPLVGGAAPRRPPRRLPGVGAMAVTTEELVAS